MHYLNSKALLSKNQYGFTPQTSTLDAIMAVKKFVDESLGGKNSVGAISLDVQGAFDNAWWPSILNALKNFQCPQNLYKLTESYLNERQCELTTNSI